ncbi:MAG: hypothetical protein J5642_04915 [Bacteroidales bacterium]|nr:hypothetical protein [Bacteroidales bacterium]
MRKTLLLIIILVLWNSTPAQEDSKPKVVNGFSGGMMLHTGYLFGEIPEIGYTAKGVPLGIGGKICIHLGQHWMVGGEGYVSTLHQLHNGSYIKYGWGGILGEFYWAFKHVMPYIGLTVGGGAQTTFLMFDGRSGDWTTENNAIFHKQSFCALTPFIGCDFILTKVLHLTLKADWMNTFSRKKMLEPTGPRFHVGLIFYH